MYNPLHIVYNMFMDTNNIKDIAIRLYMVAYRYISKECTILFIIFILFSYCILNDIAAVIALIIIYLVIIALALFYILISKKIYKLNITIKLCNKYIMSILHIDSDNIEKYVKDNFREDFKILIKNNKIKKIKMKTHSLFVLFILKELNISKEDIKAFSKILKQLNSFGKCEKEDNKNIKDIKKHSETNLKIIKNYKKNGIKYNNDKYSISIKYLKTGTIYEKAFMYNPKQLMCLNSESEYYIENLLEHTHKFKVTINKQ